ncbi:MAG TPA: hypothetical protein VGO52_17720 [Hyphomonadaceae bacterium]|nr:hypothetical protein [Hyphomonadaceae bacterium]
MKRIKASGFEPIDRSGWDEKFFGREYLDSGVAIYRTYASRFPCSDEFFIAVKFDEQARLEKAEGTWINAACL